MPDRPNILFVFTDQQRPDWLEMNPEIPVRTPNLKALADRGVWFSNAVCPTPLCAPCRSCLVSGNEYDQPYYLPYTVLAYQDSYNIVENLHDYFLEFYADTLPILFNGYHSSNEVNSIMPSVPIEIFHPEVIEEFTNNMDHPLRVRLEENDLIYWAPQAPTILYHSDQDELVPVENSENAYFQFIFNGAPNVEFVHSPLGSHSDAAILIIFQVINWFNTLAQVGTLGDLTEDGVIDIQDIILLVNLVLDIMNTTYFYSWAGDLNSDGNLDIYDVILLITVILEAY